MWYDDLPHVHKPDPMVSGREVTWWCECCGKSTGIGRCEESGSDLCEECWQLLAEEGLVSREQA